MYYKKRDITPIHSGAVKPVHIGWYCTNHRDIYNLFQTLHRTCKLPEHTPPIEIDSFFAYWDGSAWWSQIDGSGITLFTLGGCGDWFGLKKKKGDKNG